MRPIKKLLLTLVFILSIFYIDSEVLALPSISINENDYELVCIYSDGAELTITRDLVSITNESNNAYSNAIAGIKFYLTSDQQNVPKDSGGGIKEYKHAAITEKGKCPSQLYVYDMPQETEDGEKTSAYYYSTRNDIEEEIGGTRGFWFWERSVATYLPNLTTTLVSERVYLTSRIETTICDYEIPSTTAHTNSKSMSVFLYGNLTIADINGYLSVVDGSVWPSCKNSIVNVNDPSPKAINDDGSGVSASYRYNAVRYYVGNMSGTCANSYNDSKTCDQYTYIGSRIGDSEDAPGSGKVCTVLGDDTITQLKRIISILQIIVPVLTITLTAIDLGKLVLSGNLDEELPKKKKVISVRFWLMVFFFFLPLITDFIIEALQESGVVGIEEVDCLTD